MPAPIESMIEALNLEIKAIKRNTSSSVLELRAGFRQGVVGSDTLYSFPLSEEPNLRDDSPVKIVIAGKEVDGTVVSLRNGVLTVALVQDLGEQIPFARLVVNDSFLVERLRDKLLEIQRGEFTFNTTRADGVLTNCAEHVAEAQVPDVVFLTQEKPLNPQQRRWCARRLAAACSMYGGLPVRERPPRLGPLSTRFTCRGSQFSWCRTRTSPSIPHLSASGTDSATCLNSMKLLCCVLGQLSVTR